MKPTFSPQSTVELNQAIAVLEHVYHRELLSDARMQLTKLSTSIGELLFVAQSTSKKPEAVLPAEYVRVIQLDEVTR